MAVDVGCEEVEEEGAPQCGDVPVLRLCLNIEAVRLRCVSCVRCVACVMGRVSLCGAAGRGAIARSAETSSIL